MRHSLYIVALLAAFAPPLTAAAQAAQLASSATPTQAYLDFQVEKPVASRPGNPHPAYPASLRSSARAGGEVVAQFVVDTMGRVDMSTFEVVKATDKAFTEAVRAVLPEMRFYPAEIGGHKVRQLAQQDFLFAAQ